MKKFIVLTISIISLPVFGQNIVTLQNDINKLAEQISKDSQQLITLKENAGNNPSITAITIKIKEAQGMGKLIDNQNHQKLLKQLNDEYMKIPEIKGLSDTINSNKTTLKTKKEELEKLKYQKSLIL
jgi:predicted RND superfamily exporter protein